jgi:hypothetical protein
MIARRSLWAAAGACGLHVMLVLAVRAVRPVPAPPMEEAPVVEIFTEPVAPEMPPPDPTSTKATTPSGPLAAGAAVVPRSTSAAASAVSAIPDATAVSPPAPVPEPGPAPAPAQPHLSLAQLGLSPGGGAMYLPPSAGNGVAPTGGAGAGPGATAPADGKSEASRRTENMLRADLAAHDTAIGLGPDGPVIAALEDHARRSVANGRATFDITVDARGLVVSLTAVGATESHDDWRAVGAQSLAALKGKTLRRKGPLSMRIEVDARIALPSGADPGVGVDVAGIPLKKGDGPKSAKVSVGGTPFGPGVTLQGDLADIGAKTRRVVHAHVVRVSAL